MSDFMTQNYEQDPLEAQWTQIGSTLEDKALVKEYTRLSSIIQKKGFQAAMQEHGDEIQALIAKATEPTTGQKMYPPA